MKKKRQEMKRTKQGVKKRSEGGKLEKRKKEIELKGSKRKEVKWEE